MCCEKLKPKKHVTSNVSSHGYRGRQGSSFSGICNIFWKSAGVRGLCFLKCFELLCCLVWSFDTKQKTISQNIKLPVFTCFLCTCLTQTVTQLKQLFIDQTLYAYDDILILTFLFCCISITIFLSNQHSFQGSVLVYSALRGEIILPLCAGRKDWKQAARCSVS